MPNNTEMEPVATRTLNAEEHSELLAVYQTVIADIRYWKSQQWNVTNYAVLLYVAVLGTGKILKDGGVLVSTSVAALILFGFIVLLLALYVLGELEGSLKKSRGRLERVLTNFAQSIREEIFENVLRAQDKTTLIRLFQFVVASGFLTVVTILWTWKCGI